MGSGDGQFFYPNGIAVDAVGDVYVADELNHRIQKFTGDGTFLTKWGTPGKSHGQFNDPRDVTVDARGIVYVADSGNGRIQKFDRNGTFLGEWDPGIRSGTGPWTVGADANGSVYVGSDNHVGKYDPDGAPLGSHGWFFPGGSGLIRALGVAGDARGNAYVVWDNREVHKYDSDLAAVLEWGSPGSANGQFLFPAGIAVDTNGDVYVADYGTSRIQVLDPEGAFVTAWGSSGSLRDVAVDSEGAIYVVDSANHRVLKFRRPVSVESQSWSRVKILYRSQSLNTTRPD